MNVTVNVDGQPVVKMEFDLVLLVRLIREAMQAEKGGNALSTPATTEQMQMLLSRVDPRSVVFLKEIAASPDGRVHWDRAREIFSIEASDDWGAYSRSFGKGMTRAYRHILGDKIARLIAFDDNYWDTENWSSPDNMLWVDGPALTALREAVSIKI